MICTIKLDKKFTSYIEVEEAVEYMRSTFGCKPKFEAGNFDLTCDKWNLYYKSQHIELWMNSRRVSIKTSLWKYFIGNNLYTFTNEQILESIEKVQYNFPFTDWKKSTVSILHIGPSLNVPRNPDVYIEKFYGKKSMTWTSNKNNGNTKSIGAKNNYMIIYNKAKENNKKSTKKIIRIEYRIESPYWFEKYFGNKHPTLDQILKNIDELPKIWYDNYQKIEKDYTPEIDNIKSIAELHHLTINIFGYERCDQLIDNSYSNNVIVKNQRDYLRKYIKNLRNSGKNFATAESPILELDRIVENFMKST